MRPWSEMLCDWLVDYYALATVVLVAAVAVMGRQRQPARRLLVARSGLAGLAMLAILAALPGWPRSSWRVQPASTPPARPPVVADSEPDPGIAMSLRLAGRIESPREAVPARPLPPARGEKARDEGLSRQPAISPTPGGSSVDPMSDWEALAVRAFLAGGSLMLAWLGIGSWQTTAIWRRSRPAPRSAREALARVVGDGQAAPDLLLSGRLGQPVAVGLLRPTIILPDRFAEHEPGRRLEAALAHEWAHIRNRDLWWIAFSRILMPVLFAHPVYWWLRRRARDDQELLADAAAADGRVEYAEALLSWAREASDRPRLAVAGSLALWERPSQLKRRIVMLLDREFRVEPTCPKRWGLGVRVGMALAVLALSVLTFRPAAVGADPPGSPVAPQAGPKPSNGTESGATVRVFDPDGKPAAGAAVYRFDTSLHSKLVPEPRKPPVLLTRTGPDGSFRLSPDDAKDARENDARFVITAEGYGPAFVDASVGDGMKVLRLARDDVPIRGRVIDIQGRPVAGATIVIVAIQWHPSGNLDEWFEALKTEKFVYNAQFKKFRTWSNDEYPLLFPAVKADRDGRFTLKGIGRERIASLLVSGPGVETRFESVATRDMPAVKVADFDPRQYDGRDITYHGATCDMVAGPGLEIVGTVRDKDNGLPLAGVSVQNTAVFTDWIFRFVKTTTDAEGLYRLPGLPPKTKFGDAQQVLASLKDGRAYVPTVQQVANGRAPGPIRMDFALKRGAWARGRVTDKSTGKPVRASLSYFILEDNPHRKDYPPYGTIRVSPPFHADEDGAFRIVVIPGRGILGARLGDVPYRLGVGIDKIKGLKEYQSYMSTNFNTIVEIDPKPGDESVTADIVLDRGRTLKGKLVGPDGEPVAGARMMGAGDFYQSWSSQPLPSADFEVHALGARGKRGLLFYHEAKQLAGAYVVKPDESGPVTVRLEPCGTLTGRLVDDAGLPRARAHMYCERPYEDEDSRFEKGSLPSPIKTDQDGRFRVSGLVPGLKYSMRVWGTRRKPGQAGKDVIVKAAETRDLGDVYVTVK